MAKSKKKPVAKAKPVKKAAKPVKKSAAKPVKKAPAKSAKKAPAKAPQKAAAKPAKKAAAKPIKKIAATAAKKTAVKSTKPGAKGVGLTPAQAFEPAKPNKKIDLSNFVTPLDDRVMVQVAEAAKKTAGGLYIPDTVTTLTGNYEGIVVSVGRGRLDQKGKVHPMDVKVGDKVMFPEYSASKIKIQDQDLMILRESDVLGVVGSK